MRFIDFLYRYDWSASYRGELLDARRATPLVEAAARALNAMHANFGRQNLMVFCAFNSLEVLLCYFIASRLGLMATVLTPRALQHFIADLDPRLQVAYAVADGHRLPPVLADCEVVRLNLREQRPDADQLPTIPYSDRGSRLVFYTSGTTGKPKRVVCAEESLIANAVMVANYLELRPGDRTLCAFPVTFMFGLSTTLCTLHSGGHIELCEFLYPGLLAERVQLERFTVLPLIGDWAIALSETWKAHHFHPSRLLLLNASDRLLVHHVTALRPMATALWNNFGQTESGPRIFAINLCKEVSLEAVSYLGIIASGRPAHPDIELRITPCEDADGFGTLSYRTPFAMLGYLQDDGSIQTVDDWIESGDLCRLEPNGVYLWAGRSADTIKINGKHVSIRALADDILRHTGITGVGYAKNPLGDLCLFVEAVEPPIDLRARLNNCIADVIRGKRLDIRIVPALPRTESGKIDFKQLNLSLHPRLTP